MTWITRPKSAGWVAALVWLGIAAGASGGEPAGVCDRLIWCRNYSGLVIGKEADGTQSSAFERRVAIFKLSPGTVMVATLVVFGDGGRTFETSTWDFTDEEGNPSRVGKFTVFDVVPDIGGTNKIGAGRCAQGTCTYEIARPKDERKITGTMRFENGVVRLDETEATTYQGKPATTVYTGRLSVDEK